jgi:hypothetical protein
MDAKVPTAHTRLRRRNLKIVERRPSVTKIFDRWTLTIQDLDVDLAICDGVGNFVYRDRRTGYVGPWDDHCLLACEFAEDPRNWKQIETDADRRSQTSYASSAAIGPCSERMIARNEHEHGSGEFDLSVLFRQLDGSLVPAHRGWRDKTAGIYMIRSLAEGGGTYVGESGDIINRWLQHQSQLKSSCHANSALQAAWNAHGTGIDGAYGFEWIVLEVLPAENVTLQQRRAIEMQWIQSSALNGSVFNIR